jgi:glycosyltransferase involved in cell wall biosynthesis
LRIALVTTSFLPTVGGAELVVHHLAKGWSQSGHEVKVFCEENQVAPQSGDSGYTVQTYPLMRGTYRFGPHRFPFRQYNTWSLSRKLIDFAPEMISAHFGYPVGVWLSNLPPMSAHCMVTCHGKDLSQSEWGYRNRYHCDYSLGRALNTFPGVIAISGYARQQMEELGVDGARIYDVPNGVDIERFQKTVPATIRARHKVPKDAILILSVGRNSGEKAYLNAIEAVSRLKPDSSKEVYYLIVGSGVESLSSVASSCPEGVKIILCNGLFDDDLVSAYQEADIYFSASTSELFPLTVLEAMAAGLPLVLTDISGHQDVIDPGVNGFLVPADDGAAAALLLTELIDDPVQCRKMGSVNRERVSGYSWANICKRYLDLAGMTASDQATP